LTGEEWIQGVLGATSIATFFADVHRKRPAMFAGHHRGHEHMGWDDGGVSVEGMELELGFEHAFALEDATYSILRLLG
jgi:hypothetical protein